MICTDCGESITETERLGSRSCIRCKKLMHGECAMSTSNEDDICEGCFNAEGLSYRQAMKKAGAEA